MRSLLGTGGRRPLAVYVAAYLCVEAALIHLWVVPESFDEWWGYGAFFLAGALAQAVLSFALLRRPTQAVAAAGIGINLALIAVYVLSRTSGIPVGPHTGVIEFAGVADMVSTAAEVGTVIALTTTLTGRPRRVAMNGLLLVGVLMWTLRLTGALDALRF